MNTLLVVLFLVISLIAVFRFLFSQMEDKDNNIKESRNIIYPGSVQTSYPRSNAKFVKFPSELDEELVDLPETPEPVERKKTKKQKKRHPLFSDREEIRRSFLIDELLNKKTNL